ADGASAPDTLPSRLARVRKPSEAHDHRSRDRALGRREQCEGQRIHGFHDRRVPVHGDRKSTRLNSSHVKISYAVFCWKKKKRLTPISTPALRSAKPPGSSNSGARSSVTGPAAPPPPGTRRPCAPRGRPPQQRRARATA